MNSSRKMKGVVLGSEKTAEEEKQPGGVQIRRREGRSRPAKFMASTSIIGLTKALPPRPVNSRIKKPEDFPERNQARYLGKPFAPRPLLITERETAGG
jgi:hypothetical protein